MKYRNRIIMELDSEHDRATINELAKMLANRANEMNGVELVYLATEQVVEKQNFKNLTLAS